MYSRAERRVTSIPGREEIVVKKKAVIQQRGTYNLRWTGVDWDPSVRSVLRRRAQIICRW